MNETLAKSAVQAVLVSHTHWDREWYLTVEQLRPRLVRLFENLRQILTNEPDYPCYWLDGQTSVLEDYWETIGEQPNWLEEALHRQQILCGPWYTLVDEWLVGAESIVRNLFEGRRIMQRYGQENLIGYLPDSFGHVSQMPAILHGFGMDNAFFFRGIDEESLPTLELWWASAQGEAVLGSQLRGGYSNAQRIDAERHLQGDRAQGLVNHLRELENMSATGVLLLLNGVDQALPTHRLDRSMQRLSELMPELEIKHGSLADYLILVRQSLPSTGDLPAYCGELLHSPYLDAALSGRGEQKITNRRVENLLTYHVEPLLGLSTPADREHNGGLLRLCWRLAMLCHAHDAISGCHSDLVAADIANRLSRAEQMAEALEHELWVQLLGMRPNEHDVCLPSNLVFRNPLPWQRQEVTEVELDVPAGIALADLVFQQDGQSIAGEVLSVETICRWTEHYFGKVHNKATGTQRVKALILPAVGPGGFADVAVTGTPTAASQRQVGLQKICRADNVLDNGVIRVVVHLDGRLDITALASGEVCGDLNMVIDSIEHGDLYEHIRARRTPANKAEKGIITVIRDSDLRGTVSVATQIICNSVACPLQMEISLNVGESLVRVRTSLDNRSCGHWLQMACPVPNGTQHLLVHTPFDLIQRSADDGAPYDDGDKTRFARRLGQPVQWGLFARGTSSTLGIFNRGLYEYTFEDGQIVNLSLMRFVGLIRPDLTNYPADGANRPGWQSVEYAIGLWSPDGLDEGLRWLQAYNLPLRASQVFGDSLLLPDVKLELSNPYWVLSTFKSAETGEALVLRVWNASDNEQTGAIRFRQGGRVLSGLTRARLDETPMGPLPDQVTLGPKEILTVLLEQGTAAQ